MGSFKKIYFLLNAAEKKNFLFLFLLILIMAFFDALGVASIVPFVTLLTNPNLIETNDILIRLYNISSNYGVDTTEKFAFIFGILFLILTLISILLRTVTTYAITYFSLMREYSIGKRLIKNYLFQNYIWFLDRNSSEIAKSILSEVKQVVDFTFVPLMRIISNFIVAFALVLLLILNNPKLAFIVGFTLTSVYGLTFYIIKNFLVKIGAERVRANQERFMVVSEAFGATKEVKLGNFEQFYIDRFSKNAKIFSKNQVIARILALLPRYFIEALVFGGMILLIIVLMRNGSGFLSIMPTISLYIFAGYRLLPVLQQIYDSVTRLQFSSKAVDLMYNDLRNLENKKNVSDSKKKISFENSINLTDINFSYSNDSKVALKNINLSIKAFSKVGIVGSTGSGKTTIIDIILGLLDYNSGKITVDELAINEKNKRSWQKNIGYVPQQIYLSDTTIARNIAFGIDENDIDFNKIKQVSKIANLHDFVIKKLSKGYNTVIGERGVRLSGGERQRIGIARALYNNPKLIIFDEGTSALDNITEKTVLKAIDALKNKVTIIMVAHRLATVKNCDTIFMVRDGEIVSRGSYNELSKTNQEFMKMTKNL